MRMIVSWIPNSYPFSKANWVNSTDEKYEALSKTRESGTPNLIMKKDSKSNIVWLEFTTLKGVAFSQRVK